ncbi:hypothetical protein DL768_008743 [Monosporascus sp. mg162]|nr:hypothetical protein DL768_008743 [Monosporascus sp. mg162]
MALVRPAQRLTLPDERTLSYAVYGDPDASTVVFHHHGFPGSRDEALMFDEAAQRHKIRLIATDRPGMGFSTYQPNRRLLDWPPDLLALADHLKIEKFGVVGVSGGAPYVFACWKQLPRSRCVAAAIVGGLYPTSLGTDGMLLGSRILLGLGRWTPWLVGKGMDLGIGAVARDEEHPEKFDQTLDESFKSRPAPDRAAWEADASHGRRAMKSSLKEAFRHGGQGVGWETSLLGSDWGFKLEELSVGPGRMLLWHGGQDVNCPLTMAERAVALLPGAELRISEQDAHFSLVRKADEVMESMGKMLATA